MSGGGDKPKTPEYEIVQKQNLIKNSDYALAHMAPVNKEMMEEATRDTRARASGKANATVAASMQDNLRTGGMNKMGLMASTGASAVQGSGEMTAASMQSGLQSTSGGMTMANRGLASDHANNQMMLRVNTAQSQRNIDKSAKKQSMINGGIDLVGAVGGMAAADYSQFASAQDAKLIAKGDSWNPMKMNVFGGESAWGKTPLMQDFHSQGFGLSQIGGVGYKPTAGSGLTLFK